MAGVTTLFESISPQHGALVLSLSGPEGYSTKRGVRATPTVLPYAAVLHSTLMAGRSSSGTVLVHADPTACLVVERYLSTGEVPLGDLSSILTGIEEGIKKTKARGTDIVFVPAKPDDALSVFMEEARKAAKKMEKRHEIILEPWEMPLETSAWVAENDALVVYTDGSQMSATGLGAWAWWTEKGLCDSDYEMGTWSVEMEMRAVIEALSATSGPVLIVSDCVREEHLTRPMEHRSPQWQKMVNTLRSMVASRQVRFLAVKGHANCPGNNTVDSIAKQRCQAEWMEISVDPIRRELLLKKSQEARKELDEVRMQRTFMHTLRERTAAGSFSVENAHRRPSRRRHSKQLAA